jgi:hypothetical protein
VVVHFIPFLMLDPMPMGSFGEEEKPSFITKIHAWARQTVTEGNILHAAKSVYRASSQRGETATSGVVFIEPLLRIVDVFHISQLDQIGNFFNAIQADGPLEKRIQTQVARAEDLFALVVCHA